MHRHAKGWREMNATQRKHTQWRRQEAELKDLLVGTTAALVLIAIWGLLVALTSL